MQKSNTLDTENAKKGTHEKHLQTYINIINKYKNLHIFF